MTHLRLLDFRHSYYTGSGSLDHLNSDVARERLIAITETETVVTAIADKPTDGTYPCIVVTVWYEPPEPNPN